MALDDIYHYRAVDDRLATSGQPLAAQIADIAAAGFEVVVNLALHDDPRYSLPDEPASVAAAGLTYVHIPVPFAAPTHEHLLQFAAAMERHRAQRLWLHCAANYRVTAFLGLYRARCLGWTRDAAFALMHEVWQPDAVWASFIDEQLAAPDWPATLPEPASESSMADYYARRAATYERVYHKPERQADLRAMERWLAEKFSGRRVLEIACGTGWWTPHGARRAASWLATDLNPETLAVARRKPRPAGVVEFREVDAYSLAELGEATFDAAFAGFWWSHVPLARLPGWLDTLHARLEPGATVVMLDNVFVPGSSTPISRRDVDGNSYQLRHLDDGTVHEVLKNFPTPEQAFALLGPRARDPQWTAFTHYWILGYTLG